MKVHNKKYNSGLKSLRRWINIHDGQMLRLELANIQTLPSLTLLEKKSVDEFHSVTTGKSQ